MSVLQGLYSDKSFLFVLIYRMSEQLIEVEGRVISILPGTLFKVELKNNHVVLAHISGKLRKNFIKLNVGDRVKMEMSTHDLNKARIIFRLSGSRFERPPVEGAAPTAPPAAPVRRSSGPPRRR